MSLACTNFRNLRDDTIDLDAREVFFLGENGQGKSNLLEALYFLSYGNSFRTHLDVEALKYGQEAFSLRGAYKSSDGGIDHIRVLFEAKNNQRGLKKIEKNHKRIMDRKELVNTVPCILYCHDDLDFVTGDPERRRFFLDQTLSLNDVVFIELSRSYKSVLKNRNTLLKELQEQRGDSDLLNVYDRQAVQYGVDIQNRRKVLIAAFNAIFTPLYDDVTSIDGVRLVYAPSWKEQDELPITPDDALAQIAAKRAPDIALGTTLCGPHRDRVIFMRHGQLFIPGASTGQKRLAAVLLRTAQAVYYRREAGKAPVLLMDDVLLELDPEKRQRMQAALPEYDQLFCTFLTGEPYEKYHKNDAKVFTVREGSWKM